jgi:hypothetical protein
MPETREPRSLDLWNLPLAFLALGLLCFSECGPRRKWGTA